MIADSHVHAFPPLGGASGFRSVAEHLRYLQREMVFHHQPVRRVRDSLESSEQTLYNGSDYSLGGLLDVNFRGGDFGRLVWTVGGTDYSKQYLPPTLIDLAASPELMIAQMDYVGVDRAVLQTGHVYGRLNRYLAQAVQAHPSRFWALAQVNEWRLQHRSQIASLAHAIDTLGLQGLYFETAALALHRRSETVDDPLFQPFWDHVRERGIPVFWSVSSAEPTRSGYLDQFRAFARWLRRHPETPCLLTHGVKLEYFREGDTTVLPEEVWAALAAPNLMVELLFPIREGGRLDYPYAETRPTLRRFYERLGPAKLVWGSDMPNVERHCTYRQSLDYLRSYCDFIPPHHMSMICGGNVERLMAGELAP